MDIQLHYTDHGSGPPLVLLHGNGEDGSYFVHQVDYFSKTHRVIAVDTRGHGQSPRGSADFTLEQFAEDLKTFLDRIGIARADLLGFSDGANVALLFALRYPAYVDRLVLNGGNLDPGGIKRYVQWPICLGYGLAGLFARFSEEAKAHWELLRLMVKEPHIRPEALSGLSCPTLVIAGSRDMIRESHTRLMADSIPNARLVILPGDHFIANKQSAAFNEAVEAFLQRKESSK